jgi:hypothetical protein
LLGEKTKIEGSDREVTGQHVRDATIEMTKSLDRSEKPTWTVFCQAGEYLCTGFAGAGASNLDSTWGQIAFGFGLFIGIILFVTRMTKINKS